jgi:HK97 family phage prohead protease
MSIQTKTFKVASLTTEPEAGIIEAIVSVFNNVDRTKDVIRQGFFQKSLERKLPKGVWMHDWKQPVSKTLEARELGPGDEMLPNELKDLGGLYIKGQFNLETQRGREAYSDVKFGLVDEFSIGYNTTKEKKDHKSGINELLEGEFYEWSPVLVGANKQTQLLSVKGENPEDEEEEVETDNITGLLAGLTFEDHFEKTLGVIIGFEERAKNIKELREKSGKRFFSTTNRSRLRQIITQLNEVAKVTDELPENSEESETEKSAEPTETQKEYFKFVKFQAEEMLKSVKK